VADRHRQNLRPLRPLAGVEGAADKIALAERRRTYGSNCPLPAMPQTDNMAINYGGNLGFVAAPEAAIGRYYKKTAGGNEYAGNTARRIALMPQI
jgi:hypothetical protein